MGWNNEAEMAFVVMLRRVVVFILSSHLAMVSQKDSSYGFLIWKAAEFDTFHNLQKRASMEMELDYVQDKAVSKGWLMQKQSQFLEPGGVAAQSEEWHSPIRLIPIEDVKSPSPVLAFLTLPPDPTGSHETREHKLHRLFPRCLTVVVAAEQSRA
jgi:hypothetical protein